VAVAVSYSSPQSITPKYRRLAVTVVAVAIVSAALIVWHSVVLASSLLAWGNCGTGRLEVSEQLTLFVPLMCAVPGGCWWIARAIAVARVLCRSSFLVSVVGWFVALLFAT
jgi:hypothetical protein